MRLRNIVINVFGKTTTNLEKTIGNYDIVSFDVFDTLVYRVVSDPKEIFEVASLQYTLKTGKKIHFKEMRMEAERKARAISDNKEVNMDDIYSQLTELSLEERLILRQIEIDIEYKSLVPNHSMIDFYNKCKKMGMKIIITSDMYLPYEFFVNVLDRFNIKGYEKLYISSILGKTKMRGDIFDYIMKDFPELKIFHIGDKVLSDFIRPRTRGIKSAVIKNRKVSVHYKNKKHLMSLQGEEKEEYLKLINFISATIPNYYDEYERIGYEIVGPILYGFSRWLDERIKKDNIEKLFFLSREGDILKRAYSIVANENESNCAYLRVSRMATSIPCLDLVHSLDELIKRVYLPRAGTVIDLLESCGLEGITIDKILAGSNVKRNKPVMDFTNVEKENIYNSAKIYIFEQAYQQRELINGYMEQENFNGRCGLVDVGWKGTMQNNLEDLFPQIEMFGYYIGLRRDQAAVRNVAENRHGFLFGDEEEVTETQRKMSSTLSVFENFFLSTDGSTLKYGSKNGEFYPILNMPEQDEDSIDIIRRTQDAALQFVINYLQSSLGDCIPISSDNCFAAYEKFAISPTLKTINLLRRFVVYNTENSSLVASHNLLYYLIHPWILYKDFLNNTCKIIFLKSLFLLPLPYYKIWKWLHSLDKNPINPIE